MRPQAGFPGQDAPMLPAVFLPFAAGYLLSYLFRTVNGPIATRLIATFALDARSLGVLASMYFLLFAAFQLPLGVLIDRFGPRRVQATLMTVAALGALQFAAAQGLLGLLIGRALIGLGTSGALMTGLKALNLATPKERLASVNGCFVMFGGLGAMASTVPVNIMLDTVDWRGTFAILAMITLAVAAWVQLGVQDAPVTAMPQYWRDAVRGVWLVYRDPAFWRLAPLSSSVIGTAFALHGLWAARWLADVDGVTPPHIVWFLLLMGGSLTLGAGTIGAAAGMLQRWGLGSNAIFGGACAFFALVQACVLVRLPVHAGVLWGAMAAFGAMTVLSYSIVAELFAPEIIGRANGALNLLHLGSAFVVQSGIGAVVGLWSPNSFGRYPMVAYQVAFALPLALQAAALLWFALPALARAVPGVNQWNAR